MKKKLLLFILAVLVVTSIIEAQDKGLGVGVILGEPTGISFKSWTGYSTAVVGTAAWSLGKEGSLHLHLDYIFHNFNLIKMEDESLPFYYGVGIRVKNEKHVRIGVRFPLGINYMFKKAPVDIFVEFVPLFDLLPRTDLNFNGGIGIRYYF